MKNTIVIIIAIVAVIVIAVLAFKPATNNKTVITQKSITPTLAISPVQKPTTSPIIATITPSGYSAEIKAKVRSEFINNCHTKGSYSIAACNCAADYLSKNYSDDALAKMYIQYHTSNQIPAALKTAADVCTAK